MSSTRKPDYRRAIDALVEARQARGITQQELALKIGKPQSFVSKYENGERRLDVAEYAGLCKVIGVNWKTLLSGVF